MPLVMAEQVLLLQRVSLGRTTCSHQQRQLGGEGNSERRGVLMHCFTEKKEKGSRRGHGNHIPPTISGIENLSYNQTYD